MCEDDRLILFPQEQEQEEAREGRGAAEDTCCQARVTFSGSWANDKVQDKRIF